MDGHAGVLKPGSALQTGHAAQSPPAALLLAVLLASALGAVAILSSPLAALWARALADPLLHSTSAGAALTLCAVSALVSAQLLFIGNVSSATVHARRRIAASVLALAILAGNGANLWAHCAMLRAFEMPWQSAIYVWDGEANTYSYLLHSHSGKVALSHLFGGWSAAAAGHWDMGEGLSATMPGALPWVFAFAIIAAAVTALALAPAMAARGGWSLALYALAALTCIKSIADGGPLSYRFMPAMLCLSWLLADILGLRAAARTWFAVSAIELLLYSLAWAALSAEPGADAMLGFIGALALFGALAIAASRARPGRRASTASWALYGCAALVTAQLLGSLSGTPAALLLPLPAGTSAVHCVHATLRCVAHEVGGRRAFDVYREYGDDALKPRFTYIDTESPGRRDPAAVRMTAAVRPLTTGAPQRVDDAMLNTEPQGRIAHTGNVWVTWSSGLLPNVFGAAPHDFSSRNYYVFLHLAAAGLRAQGLHSFVLAPLRHAGDARAFGLPLR